MLNVAYAYYFRFLFDLLSSFMQHKYTILNALRLKTVFFMHYIIEFHFIYKFSCRLLQLQICCCLCQVVIVVVVFGVASCTLQKYFHNFYHDCNSRPKVLHSKSLVFGQLFSVEKARDGWKGRSCREGDVAKNFSC